MAAKAEPNVSTASLSYFDETAKYFLKNYGDSLKAVTTDAIHDLRVAAKRLRALLQLVEWMDGRLSAKAAYRPVRKLFKAAGPVRDHHVQLEVCRSESKNLKIDLSGYINYLIDHEVFLRENYLKAARKFDDATIVQTREQLQNILADVKDNELLFRIDQRLAVQLSEITEMTGHNRLTDAQRHKIRISTKAIRYTLEVRQLCPHADPGLKKLNTRLRDCHRALGAWHDYLIARKWLLVYLKDDVTRPLARSDDYVEFARHLQSRQEDHLHDFDIAWQALRDYIRKGPGAVAESE